MKKVLVIGGGYGGLRAIEKLAKYDNIEIVLIDKNPYHYLQTEAYGYIAGKFEVHDIAIDLHNWCQGFKNKVQFIHNEVTSIDFDVQKVIAGDSVITYDYIVIATGAETHFFSFISGLEEHSHGVKTLERAYNFRKDFEHIIYNKLQNEKGSSKGQLNIVIGGAGLSGVEVAAEMAYAIQSYSKTIGDAAKDIRISLIDASETILPGMGNYIIRKTHKRLEALGVHILTEAFIEKVDDSNIYFKSGDKLAYYFMIFTGGIIATELNTTIVHEKNKLKQFITNRKLNIEGYTNAFAIGDCVEIRDKNNNILAPTAQIAERSAEYVADSIKRNIKDLESEDFDTKVSGVFVALGGHYAVGQVFKYIKVKGYFAYLLKKAITHTYYLGLRLRINTGFDNRIKENHF